MNVQKSTRYFATKLERYKALKRSVFPTISYLDYKVLDEKHQGVGLTTYEYQTQQNSKALLYFLPAYGDYCQNYGGFFKSFASRGIRVLGMDRRGFGLSQGRRGHIHEALYEDTWKFIDQGTYLRGFPKNLPKFLIGHSHGALIATRLIEQMPDFFQGAALISPFYQFSPQIGTLQQAKIKAIQMINPYKVVDLKGKNDPELRELFQHMTQTDPFYYFKWQAQNILAIQQDQEEAQKNIDQIKTPVLMILGKQDQITDVNQQKQVFDQINIKDKRLIELENEDHFMLWYDGISQKIESDILDWILPRIK
ncbi:UNKNOWN [Stylonychia lemnae]|uniref:Serine aminopeptidase S33 domain-containing protein n=1 Tax=Stylonychia lemnae TaxID=5949 RepID=A0A078AF18_STYLE|nr:UNKNOWN [Stylonychia lemnae]|eukprot:CDW80396.1 UNKNOWN [Stylonychia lemnae]